MNVLQDRTDAIIDFPNEALPFALVVKNVLAKMNFHARTEVLESMTESEFIDHRVDIYLQALGDALLAEIYTPDGCGKSRFRKPSVT